ncbi:hypothetical protein YB2330_004730 [Saitoella coloradoensis]
MTGFLLIPPTRPWCNCAPCATAHNTLEATEKKILELEKAAKAHVQEVIRLHQVLNEERANHFHHVVSYTAGQVEQAVMMHLCDEEAYARNYLYTVEPEGGECEKVGENASGQKTLTLLERHVKLVQMICNNAVDDARKRLDALIQDDSASKLLVEALHHVANGDMKEDALATGSTGDVAGRQNLIDHT